MLTSGELQQLLQQRGILDLQDVPEAPLDSVLSSVDEQGKLYGVPGGSGGAPTQLLFSCCLPGAVLHRLLHLRLHLALVVAD